MKRKYILKTTVAFIIVILNIHFVVAENNSSIESDKIKGISDNNQEDGGENPVIRYEDYIYQPNIKTVRLYDESYELSQPSLILGSGQNLKLSFDDLDTDLKNYNYTIVHCNAYWQPSDLRPTEFIDGFQENYFSDYKYSFNTLQRYVHYNAYVPGNNMKITKSGNYIVKVYLDSNQEKLVLTKRFVVFENKISIKAKVTPSNITAERYYRQEVDFTINYDNYTINNPYSDLIVVITQNNRWDNAKTALKPSFIQDNNMVYNYNDNNVFDGDNEYRSVDIKSIRYHAQNIADITYDKAAGYNVYLSPDEKRAFKRYSYMADINGNYAVKIQEGDDSEVEADYCYVNFFLSNAEVFTDGNLYVLGAYNGWQFGKENLMVYNEKRFGYEAKIYLKQGYYNYEYGFVKDGDKSADNSVIEGMHSETENDYTIYVYHRTPGIFYDKLIGITHINSIRQ